MLTGYPFKSAAFTDNEHDLPLLRGANIMQGYFKWEGVKRWPSKEVEEYSKYLLEPGDVILAMDRPWIEAGLKQACVTERDVPCLLVQRVSRLRGKNGLLTSFLRFLIASQSFTDYIKPIVTGVNVPHISGTQIQSFKFRLPPPSTQSKIASVLSAYDDLIENNARRIEILEEMAQRIYREWFVNFRFPDHEKVKMVDSELGPIPEKWEIKSLQEVCTRITDGSHRSPKTTNDGFPMASVKDMHPWGFHIPQCRKIARQDYEELVRNDCKPLKGDVLVAKDGSYLKHIFVVDEDFELVILSSIALLRPNGRILPHLLSLYLLDPNVKSRMAGYVSGVAIPRIVLKDFRKFPVIAPPLDIQKHFLDLTSPIIRDCQLLMKKNDNLRQTRDLLLPKLISGEVDVTKLDPTSDTLTVG